MQGRYIIPSGRALSPIEEEELLLPVGILDETRK